MVVQLTLYLRMVLFYVHFVFHVSGPLKVRCILARLQFPPGTGEQPAWVCGPCPRKLSSVAESGLYLLHLGLGRAAPLQSGNASDWVL